MELRYIQEVTGKGLWQYFEMRTEGERCIKMEPKFLACETRLMIVVPVTEIQRVESMHFIWIILSLRNL